MLPTEKLDRYKFGKKYMKCVSKISGIKTNQIEDYDFLHLRSANM